MMHQQNKPSILIISQDPKEMATLQAGLELSGFQHCILTAENPEQARDIIAQHTPHVLIYHPTPEDEPNWHYYQTFSATRALPLLTLGSKPMSEQVTERHGLMTPHTFEDLLNQIHRFVPLARESFQDASPVAEDERLQYQALFHHLSDAVLLIDVETHRIVEVNHQAEQLYGYSRNELVGMSFLQLVAREEYVDVWQNAQQMMAQGAVLHVHPRTHIKKDGTPITVSLNASVIDYGGRKVFQNMVRDETARMQTELALRQSEERYRTLVDTSPHGIQECDPYGIITFSNGAHARMHGYAEGDLHGKAVWDLLASKTERDDLRAYLDKLVREQPPPTPYVTQDRTQDGRVIDVQVDWNYKRDAHGRVTGFVSIISDITKRKRLENQLRQAQKMQAIGTLAGGIAHEFNNILAAMIGFTELTTFEIPHATPAYQRLQEVLAAGKRAKDLVQQILTFSRQHDPERQPLQLPPLVHETLVLLRASLPTTITIQSHITQDPGTVLANPTQMLQILMNLSANAEYAMRETGGLLEIGVDTVDVGVAFATGHPPLRPGAHVCLTVRDTGPGIAPEVRERLFEPFFTTKAVGEGTGMGLAIVHGIVTSHDGALTVESKPGKGTTFAIYIPRIDQTMEHDPHIKAPLSPGTGRILFVDDEAAITISMQYLLEMYGYDVITSTSSVDALETFRANPPHFDLVITDQTMPDLTGERLAGALRCIRPDIPIILCTGFSYVIDAERAKATGIDAFLLKPVEEHELVATIQRVLAQYPGSDA